MEERPRLVSGLNAEYIPATWDGKDTSGIRCVGTTVLVLMDTCSPINTGGIHLPPEVIEKYTTGAETGVLVKCGGGSFLLNEDMTPWSGEKPEPGARVYIEKYAGKQIKGLDGKVYRLMTYNAIGAVYDIPAEKKGGKRVAA